MAKTPLQLRQHFIERASPLLDEYIDVALGNKKYDPETKVLWAGDSGEARTAVFDMLKDIIMRCDDPVVLGWQTGETQPKIDEVLGRVAEGTLTPRQGRDLIELITLSLEPTELMELNKKLAAIESGQGVESTELTELKEKLAADESGQDESGQDESGQDE